MRISKKTGMLIGMFVMCSTLWVSTVMGSGIGNDFEISYEPVDNFNESDFDISIESQSVKFETKR